jgi:hypothetical protein
MALTTWEREHAPTPATKSYRTHVPGSLASPPLTPNLLTRERVQSVARESAPGFAAALGPSPDATGSLHHSLPTKHARRISSLHACLRPPARNGNPAKATAAGPCGIGMSGRRGTGETSRVAKHSDHHHNTHTTRHSSHLPDVIWARKERENEIGNGGGGGKGSLAPGLEPTGKWSRTISRARRSDGDSRIWLRFARPDEARQKPCLGVPALHTAQWEMVRYGSRSLLVGLMNCWGWPWGGLGGKRAGGRIA